MDRMRSFLARARFDRLDEATGRLYVHLERGLGAYVSLPGGGPRFAETRHFHASLSGDTGGAEGKRVASDFLAALRALEDAQPEGLRGEALFQVLQIALTRRVPLERLLAVTAEIASLPDQASIDRRDIQFYSLFDAGVPLAGFLARSGAMKAEILGRGLDARLADGEHVLVFGIARSGTRWAFELVQAVLEEAGEEAPVLVDGIVDPWSAPARMIPGGGPRTTVPGRATDNHFFDDIRRDNLYFDPRREGELIEACLRDLAGALALVVPPGRRMIAKANADQTLTMLIESLRKRFPRVRLISMVRDPRNVLVSQRHFFARSSATPVERQLQEMLIRAGAIERRVAALGGHRLRYEAMRADTAGEVLRLAGFLGVTLGDEATRRVLSRCAFETMSGGRAYGDLRDGAHLRGGSSWERELSDDEKARVHAVCGKELEALGYAP